MSPGRGRRRVLAALGVYVAAVLAVVIAPVSYSGIVHAVDDVLRGGLGLTWFGSGWIEFAANVLLFVPLGLLLTLLFERAWMAVALCVAVSAAVELAQLIVPPRQASLRDIVANAVGAALGAGIAWAVMRRRRGAAEQSR